MIVKLPATCGLMHETNTESDLPHQEFSVNFPQKPLIQFGQYFILERRPV